MERVKSAKSVLERVKGSVRAVSGKCLFPVNVWEIVFEFGDILVRKVRKGVSGFFLFDQWSVSEGEYGEVIRDVLGEDVVGVWWVWCVSDRVIDKCGWVVSASGWKSDSLEEAGSEEWIYVGSDLSLNSIF